MLIETVTAEHRQAAVATIRALQNAPGKEKRNLVQIAQGIGLKTHTQLSKFVNERLGKHQDDGVVRAIAKKYAAFDQYLDEISPTPPPEPGPATVIRVATNPRARVIRSLPRLPKGWEWIAVPTRHVDRATKARRKSS